eukprot:713360-Amphidinium_carterae.1
MFESIWKCCNCDFNAAVKVVAGLLLSNVKQTDVSEERPVLMCPSELRFFNSLDPKWPARGCQDGRVEPFQT